MKVAGGLAASLSGRPVACRLRLPLPTLLCLLPSLGIVLVAVARDARDVINDRLDMDARTALTELYVWHTLVHGFVLTIGGSGVCQIAISLPSPVRHS